jgi:predicted hydrocarbon binding protein
MKGIVFNLLEDLVRRDHGDDAWELLLEKSGVSGVYTSLGSYDDAELYRLVGAATEALGVDAATVIRWFGREALPLLAQRYPEFFSRHDTARSFVLTLNDIIHPEVRKLYPGADVPDFDFDASEPDRLRMTYRSARRLCAFAEGLIEGAAAHYGEHVHIEQPACMHRGDPACVLDLTFSPIAPHGAAR